MKKVILFNMVTLDGFFEGPGHDIDWHNVDEEFNQFAIQQTGTAGALLFGRRTYELMAGYWPTEQAVHDDPEVANLMNSLPKVVFSRALKKAGWNNTRIAGGDLKDEIAGLKAEPGNDLFVFGSGELTCSLINLDLVDEYRLMVNPILLGQGTPMFKDLGGRHNLLFLAARPFRSGNLLITYGRGQS